jgi:dipeptidyl aminopeptidase/acylaminoacyl peptidase
MEQPDSKGEQELLRSLCDLQIPSSLQISPDGKSVLYSTSLTWGHSKGPLPISDLWLASISQSGSSRRFTDGTCKNHSPAWHPHKDAFAFISDRASPGVKSAIYITSSSDYTSFKPLTALDNEQAVEKFKFSPDGKFLAYISKDEMSEAEKMRGERKEDVQLWGHGYRFSRLRIIDLNANVTKTLDLERHVIDCCWVQTDHSSQMPVIAVLSSKDTLTETPYHYGTDLHMASAQLDDLSKVCHLANSVTDLSWGSIGPGCASPALYFCGPTPLDRGCSGNCLYQIDLSGGSGAAQEVTFPRSLEMHCQSAKSVGGNVIVKTQHRLDDCLISVSGEVIHTTRKQEIEAWDVFTNPSTGEHEAVIAISDVNKPLEVYSVQPDRDEMIQLSNHGEAFRSQEFGSCDIITCTADDGLTEIDAIHLTPASYENGLTRHISPRATIVLIHGGPTSRVTNAFNTLYYMWTPYLLKLGFNVLLPNYRGSSGRGAAFASLSYGDGPARQCADVLALTQRAIGQGVADADALVLGGVSHGGLISNLCAVQSEASSFSWRYKAVISVASMSDIDTMALTSDLGNAYQVQLHNGAAPWSISSENTSTRAASALWGIKEAVERSRISAKRAISPMLIIHGANDERTPVSQAYGLQRALEHYSLPFEMAIYPRQGHIFHEQKFWIDMAMRIARFAGQHTRPRS